MTLPRNVVLTGDAAAVLPQLPAASVDMVLTSPPYYRLRRYGDGPQLGLEASIDDWVRELHSVAREVDRLLTPTGSLWLNLGDSYALRPRDGASRKSLLLGPERLVLGLLGDGWIVRNKIIWVKTNPMPSSVRDRLACTWEIIYVLVRQQRYFFDLDAIREPHTSRQTASKPVKAVASRESWRGPNSSAVTGLVALKARGLVGHPNGKNPGDVLRLPGGHDRSGHHATFPLALAERAIRAGCPEARCNACRAPWQRAGNRTSRGPLQPTCACRGRSEPGLVLDPFMGTGTTGLAARNLGRDWLGVEIAPAFVATTNRRLREAPRPVAHPPPQDWAA